MESDEIRRYARHLILPEVGTSGQKKIRDASVLCVGAGGLGSPAALYLAAAGVGRLGIVDHDRVDESNLQRQILHGTPNIGRPKTESAREALMRLNPGVQVELHPARLTSQNALEILCAYDIILDGTDNFPTRYLVNDACALLKKPYLYGSIFRFEGQASVFAPHLGGPCYRCLFPQPPAPGTVPSCAEGGVLGVLPGIIGTIQAAEALKIIGGYGQLLLNRLLVFDALAMRFREIKVQRDPSCPLCGEQPTIKQLIDYDAFCGFSKDMHPDEVSVHDMKKALESPALGIRVIDVREPNEYNTAKVEGTTLLPMSELERRYQELDPSQEYYLHCKGGVRSMKALEFLRQKGFRKLKSVAGGILAWSAEIDPSVPKY